MSAAEETMWWYRSLHKKLLGLFRSLALPPEAVVLDAGSGTGGFLKAMVASFPDVRTVGIEINEAAASLATRKSGCELVRGDVARLPFKNDKFDAIVAADVLYHVAVNETAALSEFRRCLKPGGSLVLHLPAYNWMKSSHDARVHTARRYTAGGVKAMLRRSGFRDMQTGYRLGALFPLMAAWRLTAGHRQEESDTHAFPRWQDSVFYAVTMLEDALARKRLRLPFGGSVYAVAVKS